MNKTLIAGFAALLVISSAGGATAGSIVTSKQIKDGTIKPSDLSKPLRIAATESAGFSKITTVTSTAETPGLASCPPGTTLVSGGASNSANAAFVESHPQGNAWYAKSTNWNEYLVVYALCAS